MTRSYLDTSALRHLLVMHSATAEVAARFSGGSRPFTSELAVTELHRTALREPDVGVREVDAVLDALDLVPLTSDRVRAAGLLPDLPSGVHLRSLDALHVQSALDLEVTEFVTSDARQALAARAVGLPVVVVPVDEA